MDVFYYVFIYLCTLKRGYKNASLQKSGLNEKKRRAKWCRYYHRRYKTFSIYLKHKNRQFLLEHLTLVSLPRILTKWSFENEEANVEIYLLKYGFVNVKITAATDFYLIHIKMFFCGQMYALVELIKFQLHWKMDLSQTQIGIFSD